MCGREADLRVERNEFVRRLTLNEITDDYEKIDQIILPTVAEDGARLGFAVESSDIVMALAGLIEDGLARAYLLPHREPAQELPGMPCVDEVETNFKTYFYVTRKGMDFHLSDDTWWPFDDEGNPRPTR
jgi:hypothetical protein